MEPITDFQIMNSIETDCIAAGGKTVTVRDMICVLWNSTREFIETLHKDCRPPESTPCSALDLVRVITKNNFPPLHPLVLDALSIDLNSTSQYENTVNDTLDKLSAMSQNRTQQPYDPSSLWDFLTFKYDALVFSETGSDNCSQEMEAFRIQHANLTAAYTRGIEAYATLKICQQTALENIDQKLSFDMKLETIGILLSMISHPVLDLVEASRNRIDIYDDQSDDGVDFDLTVHGNLSELEHLECLRARLAVGLAASGDNNSNKMEFLEHTSLHFFFSQLLTATSVAYMQLIWLKEWYIRAPGQEEIYTGGLCLLTSNTDYIETGEHLQDWQRILACEEVVIALQDHLRSKIRVCHQIRDSHNSRNPQGPETEPGSATRIETVSPEIIEQLLLKGIAIQDITASVGWLKPDSYYFSLR